MKETVSFVGVEDSSTPSMRRQVLKVTELVPSEYTMSIIQTSPAGSTVTPEPHAPVPRTASAIRLLLACVHDSLTRLIENEPVIVRSSVGAAPA